MDSSKASKNFYCFGLYLQQYENTLKKIKTYIQLSVTVVNTSWLWFMICTVINLLEFQLWVITCTGKYVLSLKEMLI